MRDEILSHLDETSDEAIVLPRYRFSTHGNFDREETREHQIFKVYYHVTHREVRFE